MAVLHYPLNELVTGLGDVEDAKTRFLLLGQPGALPGPTGADRTSLVAVTANEVGALSNVLHELALREINLTRLEARPTGAVRRLPVLPGRRGARRRAAHRRRPDRAAPALHRGAFPRLVPADRRGRPTIEPGSGNDDFVAAAEWADAVRKGELA